MNHAISVAENLYWIGGNDRKLALFESAFPVPYGVSYNSYVLIDQKTVLFDTVDLSVSETFFEGLEHVLNGRKLDYLVVHHMEPDHSATFLRVLEKHPEATVVANDKIRQMLSNYFDFKGENVLSVKDNDVLNVGKHTLRFVFAPMIHWPEVMFTHVEESGILFSADAFGTFGALGGSLFADESNFERDYLASARRYYTNIVGKYGVQVQNVLKKLAGKQINLICPLHGPVWRDNIGWYVEKYQKWSSYTPEEKGVAVFYSSVYGHTQSAAELLASALAQAGVKQVKVYDVSVTDVSELVAEAFRLSHLAFASTTYNAALFPAMARFLDELKAHNVQNRAYALIENGSWAPTAGGGMEAILSTMKGMRKIGESVKILSAVKPEQEQAIELLAKQIAEDLKG